ncbi:MAG: GNAT family N-acetyltransferase [Chloroflexota bacterium]
MSDINIIQIDYTDPQEAADLQLLLNSYAQDPMGGGEPINSENLRVLPKRLADFPTAFSLIAYVNGQPAGLANCFWGFSTFAAKPLVNIHDFAVRPEFRGIGLSRKLLEAIEAIAQDKGCCKITLEVLSENHVAMAAYRRFGFGGYQLTPEVGQAVFWQKKL